MRSHTVKAGDTLSKIATRFYGDPSRWPEIHAANAARVLEEDNYALTVGRKLLIPTENVAPVITGRDKDDLTILVDGVELKVLSAKIIKGLSMAVSAWTAEIAWTPGSDTALDQATRAYSYADAFAYIGNELLVSGRLYTVENQKLKTGRKKILSGFSYTADAVDSTLAAPKYEWDFITLEELAPEVLAPMGLKAVFDVDTGGPFDRIAAAETDKVFKFLVKYANQRGVLIGVTPEGNMRFHRAETEGLSVGTLTEDDFGIIEFKAKFDGRDRFHDYLCIRSDAGASLIWTDDLDVLPVNETAADDDVPLTRSLIFKLEDVTDGNIGSAAEWKRNRQFLKSLVLPVPVNTWRAPNGALWREGDLVNIKSETFDVPDGFEFLIDSVEFNYAKGGRTAILQVAPPEVIQGASMENAWSE